MTASPAAVAAQPIVAATSWRERAEEALIPPLVALLVATKDDRLSAVLLSLYAAWVGYDIAWTFALWRRNPAPGRH